MTSLVHLSDETAQRFVDRALPGAVRASAEAHLAGCPECQALVESYAALGDALAGMETFAPPPDFTAGVLARVESRERVAAWERRLGALVAALAVSAAIAASMAAGHGAWAERLTRWPRALLDALLAARVGADILGPILGAVRLQLIAGCLLLSLPLFAALRRLMPARQSA